MERSIPDVDDLVPLCRELVELSFSIFPDASIHNPAFALGTALGKELAHALFSEFGDEYLVDKRFEDPRKILEDEQVRSIYKTLPTYAKARAEFARSFWLFEQYYFLRRAREYSRASIALSNVESDSRFVTSNAISRAILEDRLNFSAIFDWYDDEVCQTNCVRFMAHSNLESQKMVRDLIKYGQTTPSGGRKRIYSEKHLAKLEQEHAFARLLFPEAEFAEIRPPRFERSRYKFSEIEHWDRRRPRQRAQDLDAAVRAGQHQGPPCLYAFNNIYSVSSAILHGGPSGLSLTPHNSDRAQATIRFGSLPDVLAGVLSFGFEHLLHSLISMMRDSEEEIDVDLRTKLGDLLLDFQELVPSN